MIAFGCEDKYRTPVPEDRICPECGREIEVFVSRGRIVEDSVCECGHVIRAEEPVLTIPGGQKEADTF